MVIIIQSVGGPLTISWLSIWLEEERKVSLMIGNEQGGC